MFNRMGLGNRLNLIVISINLTILVLVAFLANASSASALRTQAINRFEVKSQDSFEVVNRDLLSLQNFAFDVANLIANLRALNVSSEVNSQVLTLLSDTEIRPLIYSISIYRPEGSVVWIGQSSINEDLVQTRLRIVSDLDAFDEEPFSSAIASDVPTWFLQDPALFDFQEQATISVSVPYEHASGRGLIWIDILQSDFRSLVVEALNQDGLLLETIGGYVIIEDQLGQIIDTENLNGSDQEIIETSEILDSRLSDAEVTNEGLLQIEDPFNGDASGLVKIEQFTANRWQFIALMPESEIPALPTDVYLPIFIVGIIGIAVLVLSVNSFINQAVVRPVNDLGRSAAEIGDGNLRFIVFHQDKKDEIGRLASSMENMRNRLRETYDELQNWSHTLEVRVEERTDQLKQARKQAEHSAKELQVVYDESLTVVNEPQLQPVLDTFIDRILMLLEAKYCAIWLLSEDRQHVHQVASNDSRRRISTDRVTMSATQGIVGQAIHLDAPIIANDYQNYEHRVHLTDHYQEVSAPFSRGVCAPLKFAGFAIGAVVVGRDEYSPPFDAEAQRLLTLFTNMVSPSVRNAQLFSQLQIAVEDAKQANEVKTRFLASVTHELRTPLNLIINNIDFMRVGAFGDVNSEQVSRLNQTVRSAEHLLYLINDLLDVSKIEAGEMQLFIQKQDLNTMLEDAVDNAYALLELYDDKVDKVSLNIEIDDELSEISMDSRRIRQVLNNLLSNAIKFTQEGTVTLKVFQSDEGVHFSVHDTGMGIPADEMRKLFLAFERTNAAKQSGIEGTGLGLPISRYLVNQHGSDLNVTSDVGVGTTFAFHLPFNVVETKYQDMSDTQQIAAILTKDE